MSDEEKDQESTRDDQHAPVRRLSDEGKKRSSRCGQAYDDDRQTAVLPGTDNTITGVAVNEWLDDDGNPKFGQGRAERKAARRKQTTSSTTREKTRRERSRDTS